MSVGGEARATGWRWEGTRSVHDDGGCAAYGRTRTRALQAPFGHPGSNFTLWRAWRLQKLPAAPRALQRDAAPTPSKLDSPFSDCHDRCPVRHAVPRRNGRLPNPPPSSLPAAPRISNDPTHPHSSSRTPCPGRQKKKKPRRKQLGDATTRHQDVPSQPKRCHDDQRRDAVWPPPPPPAPTYPPHPPKKNAASKKRYTPRCYAAVPCRNTASATAPRDGPPISGAACRSRHAMIKTSDPK